VVFYYQISSTAHGYLLPFVESKLFRSNTNPTYGKHSLVEIVSRLANLNPSENNQQEFFEVPRFELPTFRFVHSHTINSAMSVP
jgi:hypothetical protein